MKLVNWLKCQFNRHDLEIIKDNKTEPILYQCRHCKIRMMKFRSLAQAMNWGFMNSPDIPNSAKKEFLDISSKLSGV